MFKKYIIEGDINFEDLRNVNFEDIVKGRKGAVLVDCKDNLIPIVRTTTVYHKPVQPLLDIHYDIINKIKQIDNSKHIKFNNALIEIYDNTYHKMGFHTDQSLDLEPDSYICLFSCYENPNTNNIRKLVVKNKHTSEISEVLLENNSIVIFSATDNQEHLHKIILENPNLKKNPKKTLKGTSQESNEKWLGITFRLSKTYVKFNDDIPYINDKILTIANDIEKKEFLIHKGNENYNINYIYPEINYTISPSDVLPVLNI